MADDLVLETVQISSYSSLHNCDVCGQWRLCTVFYYKKIEINVCAGCLMQIGRHNKRVVKVLKDICWLRSVGIESKKSF